MLKLVRSLRHHWLSVELLLLEDGHLLLGHHLTILHDLIGLSLGMVASLHHLITSSTLPLLVLIALELASAISWILAHRMLTLS